MVTGRLSISPGQIRDIHLEEAKFKIHFAKGDSVSADWVVNCTGIESERPIKENSLTGRWLEKNSRDLNFEENLRVGDKVFLLGPIQQNAFFKRKLKLGTMQSLVGIREQVEIALKGHFVSKACG
jgi:hypothetical protein